MWWNCRSAAALMSAVLQLTAVSSRGSCKALSWCDSQIQRSCSVDGAGAWPSRSKSLEWFSQGKGCFINLTSVADPPTLESHCLCSTCQRTLFCLQPGDVQAPTCRACSLIMNSAAAQGSTVPSAKSAANRCEA